MALTIASMVKGTPTQNESKLGQLADTEKISGKVTAGFAYVVQTVLIRFRVAGRTEQSTQELRVTMVVSPGGRRLANRTPTRGFP
jgi:hypothetical protein